MAKQENLLTAKQVQAAIRKGEPVRLNDGGGLYLSVIEKNKASWYMRGRLNGVQKKRVLGHEDMPLSEARILRNNERKALKEGVDSVATRKAQWERAEEEGRTFSMISDEWLEFWKQDKDERTIHSTIGRLRKHILPALGKKTYSSLTFGDLKPVCANLTQKDHREMANRIATIINQICRFAKISGYHQYNIAEDLVVLFPKPKRDTNFVGFPAITDREGVAEMLRKIHLFIESKRCSPYTATALRLFPIIPLRASSMLMAEWKDIDFDMLVWVVPAENMKGEIGQRRDFIVPLSKQACFYLKNLYNFRTTKYLFPSGGKAGHLTVEGLNKSMHLAGIPKGQMCIHGWRKVWGSLAREYGLPDKLVERGLAHASGSAVEQAYNKAEYRDIMRYAFQWWADFLDALREGTNIPKLALSMEMLYS